MAWLWSCWFLCPQSGKWMHLRYRSKQYSCDPCLLSFEIERFPVLEQFSSPHPFGIFSDTFHALVPISDWYQSEMAGAWSYFCILALFRHAYHLPVVEGLGTSSAIPWWKQASAMAAWPHSYWPQERLFLEDYMLETLFSLLPF